MDFLTYGWKSWNARRHHITNEMHKQKKKKKKEKKKRCGTRTHTYTQPNHTKICTHWLLCFSIFSFAKLSLLAWTGCSYRHRHYSRCWCIVMCFLLTSTGTRRVIKKYNAYTKQLSTRFLFHLTYLYASLYRVIVRRKASPIYSRAVTVIVVVLILIRGCQIWNVEWRAHEKKKKNGPFVLMYTHFLCRCRCCCCYYYYFCICMYEYFACLLSMH